jgi:guanine deaminase
MAASEAGPDPGVNPGVAGNPSPEDYLNLAVQTAVSNVADGGGPFGAVVVTPDGRVHYGVNRVTRDNDPTAHAEVVAIRRAAADSGNFDLKGSVLYTSCEPCPLCLAAALWARIDRVYYAADRHGAAAAGFDDALFYEYFGGSRPDLMPVSRGDIPTSDAPFQAWREFGDRVEY